MVAWFIIAIATLAIFAFVAVNGVTTVASTTDGIGRIETARRLDAAAAALIARSGSPNNTGQMLVLAGSTVNGVYGLPAELSAYSSTPFGQRIVYCPFGGGEGGTASTVPADNMGNTYNIQTKADATGRVYVTDGRPGFPQVSTNPNLMGFLIAPRTKTSPTPACSSVRFNATTLRFEAPDAFVRGILRTTSADDQRQQAAREVVYYVSVNGTGRGLSPTDPTSLYAAVTYYRSALPQAMRIFMAQGSYVLPSQYLNALAGGFSDKGNAGTLVLEGQGSQLDFDTSTNPTSDIWVPGNIEIRNLTVATKNGIWAQNGHKVTLLNTTTGFILVNVGGILQATNITATDSGRLGFAFYVNDGGTAVVQGTANLTGVNGQNVVAVGGGSRASFVGATVNIGATSGTINQDFYTEPNSDLVFKNATINVNAPSTYGIGVSGRVTAYSTTLAYTQPVTYSILLQQGGVLSVQGGTYGSGTLPAYGLYDSGGSTLTGSGTMRGGICWNSGYNLAFSAATNNASSAVTADEAPPAMAASPSSADVTNNAAVQNRNTQRAQLRQTNTSAFTCQTS